MHSRHNIEPSMRVSLQEWVKIQVEGVSFKLSITELSIVYRNSHTDVAQVTESVLNDVGVLFSVKDGSQESAGSPPPHGGLGRVDDRGDQTGDNVGHEKSSS